MEPPKGDVCYRTFGNLFLGWNGCIKSGFRLHDLLGFSGCLLYVVGDRHNGEGVAAVQLAESRAV